MEEIVGVFARGIALGVGAAAVLIVAFGSVEAFVRILTIVVRGGGTHGERKEVWRRFGMWLLLGLEFELAADIIESVVSPTWIDIAQLGAIAVIRTFLNYFLEKDLESARESTGAVTPVRGEA
jgi:uncharacterized membrane protein